MDVSGDFLLKGAWYAYEQCGRLLEDAVILFDNKRYSSAVALAMFAREELGKAEILTGFWFDVQMGRTVDLKCIDMEITKHLLKQEKGRLSLTQRARGDTQLGQAIKTMQGHEPGTTEFDEAAKILDVAADAQIKRFPGSRHDARMKALYVDHDEMGKEWIVPRELTVDWAAVLVFDALNDYSVKRDNLQPHQLEFAKPLLLKAFEQWPERPELPLVRRPALSEDSV